MFIGCKKKLGVFQQNDFIDFGCIAPVGGDYLFYIFPFIGGYYVAQQTFAQGEQLKLDFIFNETSETMIKIKLPYLPTEPVLNGFTYITDGDGCSCFVVEGITGVCI